MTLRIILAIVILLLTACVPKNNYLNPNVTEPGFNQIQVVLDYVHFVDGIDELLDYDVVKNQQRIKQLKRQIEALLKDKSYEVKWAMVSSGVGLHPDMAFAYYWDGEQQAEIHYPPFYTESPYPFEIQDQLMASLMDAQRVALTPASKQNHRYLQRIRLIPIDGFHSKEDINQTDAPGILLIRVLAPRASLMKILGSGVVSVGISSGSVRGSHVGIGLPLTSGNQSVSTAVLFDNQNGQLLWKNQRNSDLSRLDQVSVDYFFKDFPVKP